MTSSERVLATLGHQEPDRVPLFLNLVTYGARELGMSISHYFSSPKHVVEAQLRMRQRYRNDSVCAFYYAALEVVAQGGEVVFSEDGPPLAGAPILKRSQDIPDCWPSVSQASALDPVLEATAALKGSLGEEAPIAGVVISPFSLPVMQMGFAGYLDLLHGPPEPLEKLLRISEEFCVEWANAQLAAGATAIVYFDPVSSPTIVPLEVARRISLPLARRVISRIQGPVAIHLASARVQALLEDLVTIGAVGVSMGLDEDLVQVKQQCQGRLAVLGNLNGVEMRRWTPQQAEEQVKAELAAAAPGGGFILSDSHGEIPYLVPEEVVLAISEAVHRWGRYPMSIGTHG